MQGFRHPHRTINPTSTRARGHFPPWPRTGRPPVFIQFWARPPMCLPNAPGPSPHGRSRQTPAPAAETATISSGAGNDGNPAPRASLVDAPPRGAPGACRFSGAPARPGSRHLSRERDFPGLRSLVAILLLASSTAWAAETQLESRTVHHETANVGDDPTGMLESRAPPFHPSLRISLPAEIRSADPVRRRIPAGLQPRRAGVHRNLPSDFAGDIAPALEWREGLDGRIYATISVDSPRARAQDTDARHNPDQRGTPIL